MIYHHGNILLLAKKAYERSLTDESESFVSIALSAMALECYINDFSHQCSTEIFRIEIESLKNLSYVLNTLENTRSTLLAKIETIHFLLSGNEIDRGSHAYQDLSMLVRLRNELVHRKPESFNDWGMDENKIFEMHKFVKYFADRDLIERPSSNSPPVWSQFINKPEIARWAYNCVVVAIKGVVCILPASHFSYIQNIGTQELEKI